MGDAVALAAGGPGAGHRAQPLGHFEPGLQAVLVEAIAEPGAGEPGALDALDAPHVALRPHRLGVEQRVFVVDDALHRARREVVHGVQRHEDVGFGRQRLQRIHPVGEAQLRIVALAGAEIVPARPELAALGHHALVGVQHRPVRGEAEMLQDSALVGAGVGDEAERLVGVAGEDHMVEPPLVAAGEQQVDALRFAGDGGNVGVGHHAEPALLEHAVDIGPGPAFDGAPDRPLVDIEFEQAMVGEEVDEGAGRELQHRAGRGRPDGGADRQQMVLDEGVRIAMVPEKRADAGVAAGFGGGVALGPFEEADDVGHHAPVARPEEVAALAEEAIEIAPAIFHRAVIGRDRKAHVGGGGVDADMAEEGREVGVVLLVIDDKAGIDRHRAIGRQRVDGIGVSAQPGRILDQRHIGALGEQPGRR